MAPRVQIDTYERRERYTRAGQDFERQKMEWGGGRGGLEGGGRLEARELFKDEAVRGGVRGRDWQLYKQFVKWSREEVFLYTPQAGGSRRMFRADKYAERHIRMCRRTHS